MTRSTLIAHPYMPRYIVIERALRGRIGELRPGDPLPSDAQLAAEWRVSRMTARNAMSRLVDEGLVVRESGRGSFVAEPPAHRRANSLMGFSSEMRRIGRSPNSRVLARELRPATAAEAAALRLEGGQVILFLRRIRMADGESIAIESVAIPEPYAGAAIDADLERGSLHEAFDAAGFVPSSGTARITAEAATERDAELLGVPEHSPLLVERRVILDERGRPLEWTESRYAAERYALDVAFS
jgi:GntR family transcriptional regulator